MASENSSNNVSDINAVNSQDSKPQPVPANRQKLIKTAIEFLQKPQIQKSPAELKRTFLQTRGLTEEEINVAFEKAGTVSQDLIPARYPQAPAGPPPPLPVRPQTWPVQQQHTSWHLIRDVANTVTAIGGLLYSLYWIWKKIIVPYLFGKRDKPKSIENSISDLEAGVHSSIDEIKQDLLNVKASLDTIAAQKNNETTSHMFTSRLQEVKAEITSLKVLLLNRSQFPPTPVTLFSQTNGSRTIPSWQLSETPDNKYKEEQNAVEEAINTENTSDRATNNGSDSSLEMIKE